MRRALRLVAAIGKNAFSDEGITSLTLPPSITTIREGAFRDNALGTLDLSANSNLTTIGDYAFYANDLGALHLSTNTHLTSISRSGLLRSFRTVDPLKMRVLMKESASCPHRVDDLPRSSKMSCVVR